MNLDELTSKISEKYFSLATNINIVSEVDGEIYRIMFDKDLCENYDFLFHNAENILTKAFDIGLVRTEYLGKNAQGHVILKHKKFEHQSMWYEWTLPQIRDAIIMTLKIQNILTETSALIFDPNTWNVTFDYTRPIFFDFGSIKLGNIEPQIWLRSFWLGGNRLQSWHEKLGITWAELQDLLLNDKYTSYNSQIDYIEKLSLLEIRQSEWTNYDKHHFKFEDEITWQDKHRTVKKLLEISQPKTVMEIGSNTGEFTKMMLKLGVKSVVACDIDDLSIRKLYEEAKKDNLKITPVCFDAFHTYNYFGGGTRQTHIDDWRMRRLIASERFKLDTVTAISLTHHICYWRNMSFDKYAEIISLYSKKWAIVEWIPYDDECLEGPINKFGKDKSWYIEDNFIASFKKYFPGAMFEAQSSPEKRKMFLFQK